MIAEWIIISLYGFSLLVICVFSVGQFVLALNYRKAHKQQAIAETPELVNFPKVTIQLPVFNEKYVAERLIQSMGEINYPKELLEIQVLDDSTDDTVEIIKKQVEALQKQGLDIQQVQRPDRVGYKAGALQYGMQIAKGEYIAVFDADFIPHPDFLLKTLPSFENENVGMVQTKWTHLNEDFSILTKIQAFWLNAHFTVEQKGREQAGSFINFNGTAGIWRKSCIEDAGGWQHDTLTEDLDLSYRAQLRGWKFVYKENIASPAELPIMIPAIKSQQYRWTKGAAETSRKMLGKVLTSKISFKHKLLSSLHLLNSSVFFLIMIVAVLSIPMLYIKEYNPNLGIVFDLGSAFLVGFFATSFFYWVAAKASNPEDTLSYFVKEFPVFLAFSMGMGLHNSIAVLEGYLGIKTPFVRTPKFNVTKKGDNWTNKYLKKSITPVTIMEGLLALYFAYGIFSGFKLEDYGLMLFHLLLAVGFAYVFILSVKPLKMNNPV